MMHQLSVRRRGIPVSAFFQREKRELLPAIAFPFLFGILAGAAVGMFSAVIPATMDSVFLISEAAGSERLLTALLRSVRYVLLAAIFSTGWPGVALLPLLAAFRGFSLSCAVAALFSANGLSGLLIALITVGVPAVIEIPCFLFVCSSGMRTSLSLLRAFLRPEEVSFRSGHFLRGVLLTAGLCTVEILYLRLLMPLLMNHLI